MEVLGTVSLDLATNRTQPHKPAGTRDPAGLPLDAERRTTTTGEGPAMTSGIGNPGERAFAIVVSDTAPSTRAPEPNRLAPPGQQAKPPTMGREPEGSSRVVQLLARLEGTPGEP
jgi:hypothetical protein